jgi:hypothetical protein
VINRNGRLLTLTSMEAQPRRFGIEVPTAVGNDRMAKYSCTWAFDNLRSSDQGSALAMMTVRTVMRTLKPSVLGAWASRLGTIATAL